MGARKTADFGTFAANVFEGSHVLQAVAGVSDYAEKIRRYQKVYFSIARFINNIIAENSTKCKCFYQILCFYGILGKKWFSAA
jgi:hypothetical protein